MGATPTRKNRNPTKNIAFATIVRLIKLCPTFASTIPPATIPTPKGRTKIYEASVAFICKVFSKNEGIKTAKIPIIICTPAKIAIDVKTDNFPLISLIVSIISSPPTFIISEYFFTFIALSSFFPCSSGFANTFGKVKERINPTNKINAPNPNIELIPKLLYKGPANPNPTKKEQ